MIGFKPFKRHANQFKYTPRFYDPEKEAREARRAELRGSRPQGDAEGEYVVGEYLRRQREARENRRGSKRGRKQRSTWFTVMGIALVFLLGYMLLPRLIGAFASGGKTIEVVKPADEYKEFDPYAPIRIVPNDYKE